MLGLCDIPLFFISAFFGFRRTTIRSPSECTQFLPAISFPLGIFQMTTTATSITFRPLLLRHFLLCIYLHIFLPLFSNSGAVGAVDASVELPQPRLSSNVSATSSPGPTLLRRVIAFEDNKEGGISHEKLEDLRER